MIWSFTYWCNAVSDFEWGKYLCFYITYKTVRNCLHQRKENRVINLINWWYPPIITDDKSIFFFFIYVDHVVLLTSHSKRFTKVLSVLSFKVKRSEFFFRIIFQNWNENLMAHRHKCIRPVEKIQLFAIKLKLKEMQWHEHINA